MRGHSYEFALRRRAIFGLEALSQRGWGQIGLVMRRAVDREVFEC